MHTELSWLCPHSSEMGSAAQYYRIKEDFRREGGYPKVCSACPSHTGNTSDSNSMVQQVTATQAVRAYWNCSQCRTTLCPVNSLIKQHSSFSPQLWAHEQGGKAWERIHSTLLCTNKLSLYIKEYTRLHLKKQVTWIWRKQLKQPKLFITAKTGLYQFYKLHCIFTALSNAVKLQEGQYANPWEQVWDTFVFCTVKPPTDQHSRYQQHRLCTRAHSGQVPYIFNEHSCQ